MDLTTFMNWMLSSGGNAIVASWVLERIAWYQNQTAEMKQYIYAGAVIVLGVLAYAIMTNVSADVLSKMSPYFLIIYGSFISVFAGKSFHKVDKN